MAESARVQSIDAIRRFRELLAEFADGAGSALAAVDAENRRAREWLENELPRHWKNQVQLWDRRMAEARSALHRKNLQRTDGFVPDVTEEKEALRIAKHRLEEAQKKLDQIRRWVPQLQHATSEYTGRSRPLADAAGPDMARSLERLDRMVAALDAYVSAAPPRAVDAGRQAASSPTAPPPAAPEVSLDWPADPEAPTRFYDVEGGRDDPDKPA